MAIHIPPSNKMLPLVPTTIDEMLQDLDQCNVAITTKELLLKKHFGAIRILVDSQSQNLSKSQNFFLAA